MVISDEAILNLNNVITIQKVDNVSLIENIGVVHEVGLLINGNIKIVKKTTDETKEIKELLNWRDNVFESISDHMLLNNPSGYCLINDKDN